MRVRVFGSGRARIDQLTTVDLALLARIADEAACAVEAGRGRATPEGEARRRLSDVMFRASQRGGEIVVSSGSTEPARMFNEEAR